MIKKVKDILSSNRNETTLFNVHFVWETSVIWTSRHRATSIVLPHPVNVQGLLSPIVEEVASRSVEEPLLHAIGPLSVARVRSPLYSCICAVPGSFFSTDWPVVIDPPLSSFVNQARRRFYTRTWTRKRNTASAATWRRSLDGWGTQWRQQPRNVWFIILKVVRWGMFSLVFSTCSNDRVKGDNVVGLWIFLS